MLEEEERKDSSLFTTTWHDSAVQVVQKKGGEDKQTLSSDLLRVSHYNWHDNSQNLTFLSWF